MTLVMPLGVAVPRTEEDVQALVRYAREQKFPLIPRGAGSGVAGESLGSGLVVDLSRRHPKSAAVRHNLAWCRYRLGQEHFRRGRWDQARADWNRAGVRSGRQKESDANNQHRYAGSGCNRR